MFSLKDSCFAWPALLGIVLPAVLAAEALALAPGNRPLAPVPEASVFNHDYEKQQYLLHEAESKARAVSKLLDVQLAAPPSLADYDAVFYDLDLRLDPLAQIVTGTVAASVVVTAASIKTLTLQLNDVMTVTQVREDGIPVGFNHHADQLDVSLTREFVTGEQVTVAVDYAGDPAGDYFGWASYLGDPLIWTLSEPYGASHWWPCKDLNIDKADSVNLHLTVPDPLIAVSNGKLVAETMAEPGWTTYHWEERYPIVPYLVSVTAHAYAVIHDQYQPAEGPPMEVVHYVIPDVLASATVGYAPTVRMLEVFAAGFGEYPFVLEKYGHAQFFWGGGMEHQTCSSMYYKSFSPTFIAHELAHQWFGDMITCANFQHIWLNEGFATWAEAYWLEQSEGSEAYQNEMNAARYLGSGTIFVEDPRDMWEIFDYDLTYLKSSWVVHMLRHVVGDEMFFAGLQQYRQTYGFSSLNTEQFRDLFQEVSGQDLGAFFDQWIYDEYYPSYQYFWTATSLGGTTRVIVNVAQVQAWSRIFTMPIDIMITTDQGSRIFSVPNSQAAQYYSFDVVGVVLGVELDPEDWILCQKLEVAPTPVPEPGAVNGLTLTAAPNPFNPRTTISFEVPAAGPVQVDIWDAAGRRVKTLNEGFLAAGQHAVDWDGSNQNGARLASGTYFIRILVDSATRVQKVTLVQ